MTRSTNPPIIIIINWLVSWSLTSLFSTNMAISETSHHRCFIVQLVYVSHYTVSFILLYCNCHLSVNHCSFTLLRA